MARALAVRPWQERRYVLRSEPDPRDVLGLGVRRPLPEPLVVRVVARATALTTRPGWYSNTSRISHACWGCGALTAPALGLDAGDYLLGDEGYCGSCGRSGGEIAAWGPYRPGATPPLPRQLCTSCGRDGNGRCECGQLVRRWRSGGLWTWENQHGAPTCELGDGPRNVLLEVVEGDRAGERFVRPFRGLRRVA